MRVLSHLLVLTITTVDHMHGFKTISIIMECSTIIEKIISVDNHERNNGKNNRLNT